MPYEYVKHKNGVEQWKFKYYGARVTITRNGYTNAFIDHLSTAEIHFFKDGKTFNLDDFIESGVVTHHRTLDDDWNLDDEWKKVKLCCCYYIDGYLQRDGGK